ncbi:MAG: hypothetical protein JNK82_43035 [Myxococcaceae bacterium]|nr:hypothetical protein [Myxococcaceae bacterium]
MRLSTESNVHLEARAKELVGESRYAEALVLLEIRFAQPDPPVQVLIVYVLCLYATGKALRGEQAARRARRELKKLPWSEANVALALLTIAESAGTGCFFPSPT